MPSPPSPPHSRRLLERLRQLSAPRGQLWALPGTGARRVLLALAQEEGRRATILEPSPLGFVRRSPEVRWLLWPRPEPPDEEIVGRLEAPGVRFVFIGAQRDAHLPASALVAPSELLLSEAEVGELAERLTAGAVGAENVRRLWLASDGWLTPLELALAAGAGTRRLEASVDGLLAVPEVQSFLRDEVWIPLPLPLRELLLELSAGEEASVELWRSVWRGDAAKLAGLAELTERWGLLLPGRRGVPRLPLVFAAFLRQERSRSWPLARSFGLCQRVALWTYSGSKSAQTLAALQQAADAGRIGTLLEAEWLELLASASTSSLRAALRQAPSRLEGATPLLRLAVDAVTGDRRRLATGLAELAARLEGDPGGHDPALGPVARALSALLRGGHQAGEVAALARRALGGRGIPPQVDELLARVEGRRAEGGEEEGLFPAESVLEHLLRAAEAAAPPAKPPPARSHRAERPSLEVRLFGLSGVSLLDGGIRREVVWPLRRAFRLFAFLASNPQLAASPQEIVEAVWPEESAEQVERNFHPTLSHLRKAIAGSAKDFPRPLLRVGGVYRLSAEIDWRIDLWEFETLLLRARQRLEASDTHSAIELHQQAWKLYQGPLLEGLDAPWIETRRERFHLEYVDMLRRLGDLLAESNELGRALDAYRAGLIADPLQERVHAAVMRIYARQGRRDLLRRQYERLSNLLREELRREPAAETLAEFHRLMG